MGVSHIRFWETVGSSYEGGYFLWVLTLYNSEDRGRTYIHAERDSFSVYRRNDGDREPQQGDIFYREGLPVYFQRQVRDPKTADILSSVTFVPPATKIEEHYCDCHARTSIDCHVLTSVSNDLATLVVDGDSQWFYKFESGEVKEVQPEQCKLSHCSDFWCGRDSSSNAPSCPVTTVE